MQDQKGIDIDLGQISLSGYPEITDWCIALKCSEVQLAEAVAAVGYSAASVRDYLTDVLRAAPPTPGLPPRPPAR